MPLSQHTPVAVIGAGSWGTALATVVARNGHPVQLWGSRADHVAALRRERENKRYLPGIPLPGNIHPVSDLAALAESHDCFLVAVPSHAFRSVLGRIAEIRSDAKLLISWGTKGFDPHTAALLSDVAGEILPGAKLSVISGPSFAREVAAQLPTALVVASASDAVAETVAGWLRSDRVRIYTNDDLAGVQLGGAIKNVMALAAGISDGLGFGANARAALITRGLAEMNRLGVALGGKAQTFMGLTGVGDLVLTCTDNQSRNRRAGIGLGEGKSLERVLADIGQEVEGVNTVSVLYAMAGRLRVDMPITEQVYNVVCNGLPADTAVRSLLGRQPRAE